MAAKGSTVRAASRPRRQDRRRFRSPLSWPSTIFTLVPKRGGPRLRRAEAASAA